MLKKFLILFIMVFATPSIFAEPTPFGLEINKTTYKNTKQKYSCTYAGINKYSLGKMYNLNLENIDVEGIKSVLTIFDKEDKLSGVIATFDNQRYDSLFNYLNKKYKLISHQNPFVGNKHAEFKDENTIIILDAPHLNFELKLKYIHNSLNKSFVEQSIAEQKQKEEKESKSL